jgi:hypothetical protein
MRGSAKLSGTSNTPHFELVERERKPSRTKATTGTTGNPVT